MIAFQGLFLSGVLAGLLVTTYNSGWHPDLKKLNSLYRLERPRYHTKISFNAREAGSVC